MRKTIFCAVIALVALFLLLPGCAGKQAPLAWQSYPVTVAGDLSGDGVETGNCSLRLTLTAPMQATVQFDKPDSLKGYTFSLAPEGVTLSYGEITVPYKAAGIPGGESLLPRMLSLTEETFLGREKTTLNSLPVQIERFAIPEGGEVRVYVDAESGIPLRFEGSVPAKDPSGEDPQTIVFTVTDWKTGE